MTDKTNKNTSEDEYQFPSDEYVTVERKRDYAEELDATDNDHSNDTFNHEDDSQVNKSSVGFLQRFPILQNKRILIVIGVVIVGVIGLHFLNSSRHKTQVISSASPAVATANAPSAKAESVTASEPSPEVMNQLSALQQAEQTNRQAMNQLQGQVSSINSSVQSANQSQQQLAATLSGLQSELKALRAQLKAMQKPKHKQHVVKTKPVVYQVRAVVPGRAWLKGSNGSSISVNVGDRLVQYGKVESIDADRGLVLTSSGKVIGFGG